MFPSPLLPTSTTWTLLSVAAFQLPAGTEVALRGKCQLALYLAEVKSSVRPSVQRVMLSERTRVHILSLDCNTFNIPYLEEKMTKKQNKKNQKCGRVTSARKQAHEHVTVM